MTSHSLDDDLVEDPDSLPPPPPELMVPFDADEGGNTPSNGTRGHLGMLEGSKTLPRQRNNVTSRAPLTTFNVAGPLDVPRSSRAVLTTSSLDRRLVSRPKSLLDHHEPNPWVPMPPPRNIPTPTNAENGHVVSSDDDQVSPTEDMPIGRPVVESASTPSEPPDFDDRDPTISWYGKTVVRFAFPIVVLITALELTAALCLVFLAPLPSFNEPTKGFEARGSAIKGKASSWWKYQHSIISDNSSAAAAGQLGSPDPLACAINSSSFFNLVIQSANDKSLWNAEAIRDLCDLETYIFEASSYVNGACERVSIGRQIALIRGKPCDSLDDMDIRKTLSLLLNCSFYYNSGALKEACTPSSCPKLPASCTRHGAVYLILHYLTDKYFMSTSSHLAFSNLPIPLFPDQNVLSFYLNVLKNRTLNTDAIEIAGIDSSLKNDLFSRLLLLDLVYFALAMEIIVIISGLYLRSFIVTIALVFDVIFTLITALFIYFVIIGMRFFPFINLLSGVVIIALAADDVFLFHQNLVTARALRPEASKAAWISYAMNHAGVSIFTTSFTTSAAFASNFVSEISAIKCFAIFASVSILCNFLLMVTLIPAVFALVITNKKPTYGKCNVVYRTIQNCYSSCKQASGAFFLDFLGTLIEKAWFIWIFIFLGLGVGGIIVVLVQPKLQLPTDTAIQAFSANNPVERFDREFRDIFPYQKDDQTVLLEGLPIIFVWGLSDIDNGDHLDPADNGTLVFDHTFMLDAPASQIFLTKFCKELRQASFVNSDLAAIPCTLDLFEASMIQPCNVTNNSKCCNQHAAPYSSYSFQKCFPSFYKNQIKNKAGPHPLGVPYFNPNFEVEVFTMGVISNQPFTTGYQPMQKLHQTVSTFFENLLKEAPHGAHFGWFTSLFGFYDVQRALVHDTPVAIGVSLGVSFVVTLLTTRSFILTLFAMITIGLSIFVTVASLVLLGWTLNALESIIISLAVGISIDFTIHYGVAFRLCKAPDRVSRMRHTLASVGPPVAMAAFTTFCAGAAIMPCEVRGYQQLGTFLMLVMLCSWVFSTIFFLSLCRIAGPKAQSSCFSCHCRRSSCCGSCCCCCASEDDEVEAVSDDSHHPDTPNQNHYHHQIDRDNHQENHRQRDICLTVYQNSAVKEGDDV